MHESVQDRYRRDAEWLHAIGRNLRDQQLRIDVNLPLSMAEAAVDAWNRSEDAPPEGETAQQWQMREQAGILALIDLLSQSAGSKWRA